MTGFEPVYNFLCQHYFSFSMTLRYQLVLDVGILKSFECGYDIRSNYVLNITNIISI